MSAHAGLLHACSRPSIQVTGILLAAGLGQRFGGDKLLAPLLHGPDAGTPLGVAAASRLAATLPGSVAVLRPGDGALAAVLAALGLRVVECADAALGMGASLACGVNAARTAGGWVVALADMPWVAPSTIAAVAACVRGGASIAAPVFRGQRGHPVGFAARHGDALAALSGDAGARALLAREAGAITLVDVEDAGIVRDVDVPADLACDQ